jgi:hypothetical protein
MKKSIHCTNCNRRINIEGPADNTSEVEQNVTCPHCKHPNEVLWPIGASYIVTPGA